MAELSFIRLAMGDFAVERRSVPRYLRWRLRTLLPGGRPLHRLLVREVWGIRAEPTSSWPLCTALEVASELKVEPGWVRLGGSSQRKQLFARNGREVVHLFSGDVADTEQEQQVRGSVGELAPRILRRCASGRGWAEEWITGRPPPKSRALKLAWEALSRGLYRPEERPRDEVVEGLKRRGLEPGHLHLLARFVPRLPRRLPCSQVHGDLWLGNMGTRAAGRSLVLFDWEYSREAPLSLDVWTFVFQPRVLRPNDPRGLVQDFTSALCSVGRVDLAAHGGPLACLHMLDKLTWVRELQGRARTQEVRHLSRWLESLTDHVCRGGPHEG